MRRTGGLGRSYAGLRRAWTPVRGLARTRIGRYLPSTSRRYLAHPDRNAADDAIHAAAVGTGFMAVTGPATLIPATPATRAALLHLFTLSPAQTARLARRKFVAANPNIYRGWLPLQPGGATYKEGIDIGPDLARPAVASADSLQEPSPLPLEADLPGWRGVAAEYYRGMEALGRMMMRWSRAGSACRRRNLTRPSWAAFRPCA